MFTVVVFGHVGWCFVFRCFMYVIVIMMRVVDRFCVITYLLVVISLL